MPTTEHKYLRLSEFFTVFLQLNSKKSIFDRMCVQRQQTKKRSSSQKLTQYIGLEGKNVNPLFVSFKVVFCVFFSLFHCIFIKKNVQLTPLMTCIGIVNSIVLQKKNKNQKKNPGKFLV